MQFQSSTKTEHRTVDALSRIIDRHSTMDHQFNLNDKEMSWDGYILLYKKNNGQQTKDNFDARVPVQIKGHNDYKRAHFGKKSFSYPVDISDLKAYSTEKGVLYFQIFVDNNNNAELYYASLFPSRLCDYLERAEKKNNRKRVSILFTRLENDEKQLYIVSKQFSEEATKQGSSYNPLVQDRIRLSDFKSLTSVSLSVVGARDAYSLLMRLSSGDVCLYGKTKDDKYNRPIEWVEDLKYYVGKDVFQTIGIGNKIYYSSYRCIADSDGGLIIKMSPNLELYYSEQRFNFSFISSLKELYRDAQFLLDLKEADSYSIQGHIFNITDSTIEYAFEQRLRYIIDLYETLSIIGFDTNIIIADLSKEKQIQLCNVVNIRNGANNNIFKEDISRYDWKFGDKYYPLLVIKNKPQNLLESAIYTDKYAVYLPEESEEVSRQNRLPLFACHKVDILGNLLQYDFDCFRKQIDECDCNELTKYALFEAVIRMIDVYDINHMIQFLELAEYLLDKIETLFNEDVVLVNSMQIKKRRGRLTNDDIYQIKIIDTDNKLLDFGKNVLIGNKSVAKHISDGLSIEEKNHYMFHPLNTLFMNM